MLLRAPMSGEENTVLSGLVGWEKSYPRSTRSNMDDVRKADCGELARESTAGDCSDHRRADEVGGIDTDV